MIAPGALHRLYTCCHPVVQVWGASKPAVAVKEHASIHAYTCSQGVPAQQEAATQEED